MNKRERAAIVNRQAISNEVPNRILVIPWGDVESKNRSFTFRSEDAKTVIESFRSHGVDLPIDIEHSTWLADTTKKGEPAPAVGWIKSLDAVDGVGLFADVEWNEAGGRYLANREYRYCSPVIWHEKETGRVLELHSVGLVNKPAIAGMQALVNKETAMDSQKLDNARWFLNLETAATAEEIAAGLEKYASMIRSEYGGATASANRVDILAAIKRGMTPDDLRPKLCEALKVPETTKTEEVVAMVNRATLPTTSSTEPDPTKFAPLSELTAAREKIETLEKGVLSINREKFIAGGMKDGRICVANRAAWEERFNKNPADAEEAIKLIPAGTYPADGTVAANTAAPKTGGDRVLVINRAVSEFKGDPEIAKVTDCQKWVQDALRREKLQTALSDEEKKLVVV